MYDWEAPFIWNDNMYISGDEAWFIGSNVNALFKLDLRSGQYYFITYFPDSDVCGFRVSRVVTQYDGYILCFPDKGSVIWAFDTNKNELQKIELYNPDFQRMSFVYAYNVDGKVFAIASGLMQIVELEITDKAHIKYYSLFEEYKQKELEDSLGEQSVLIGQCIYCIYWKTNLVCEFNVKTKEIRYYVIPNIKNGIATICYDGKYFWFSGWAKELYVWDKEKNSTRILENFPPEFGVYEIDDLKQLRVSSEKKMFERNVFFKGINVKDYICFIPFSANHIVYVDKHNFEIDIFMIPDEEEDIASWTRSMNHKYIVEYIINENIIGIYSIKNEHVIELDVEKKEFEVKSFLLNNQDKQRLWDILSQNKTLGYEVKSSDLLYLMCGSVIHNQNISHELVGKIVYEETMKNSCV